MKTEESYYQTWQIFDRILGLDLLKVIHVNDSKKELILVLIVMNILPKEN